MRQESCPCKGLLEHPKPNHGSSVMTRPTLYNLWALGIVGPQEPSTNAQEVLEPLPIRGGDDELQAVGSIPPRGPPPHVAPDRAPVQHVDQLVQRRDWGWLREPDHEAGPAVSQVGAVEGVKEERNHWKERQGKSQPPPFLQGTLAPRQGPGATRAELNPVLLTLSAAWEALFQA